MVARVSAGQRTVCSEALHSYADKGHRWSKCDATNSSYLTNSQWLSKNRIRLLWATPTVCISVKGGGGFGEKGCCALRQRLCDVHHNLGLLTPSWPLGQLADHGTMAAIPKWNMRVMWPSFAGMPWVWAGGCWDLLFSGVIPLLCRLGWLVTEVQLQNNWGPHGCSSKQIQTEFFITRTGY